MSRFHFIEEEIRRKGLIERDGRIDSSNTGMYIHYPNDLYIQVFNGSESDNYGVYCTKYLNENIRHSDLIYKIEEISYCKGIFDKYNLNLNIINQLQGASLYQFIEVPAVYIILLKDISVYGSDSIESIINKCQEIKFMKIIVDWHGLDKLCSHYMNSIYRLKKIIDEKNGELILINVDNKLMELFEITGENRIYIFEEEKKVLDNIC